MLFVDDAAIFFVALFAVAANGMLQGSNAFGIGQVIFAVAAILVIAALSMFEFSDDFPIGKALKMPQVK